MSEREEKRDLTDLKNDGVIKKGMRGPNEVSEMGCGTWRPQGLRGRGLFPNLDWKTPWSFF